MLILIKPLLLNRVILPNNEKITKLIKSIPMKTKQITYAFASVVLASALTFTSCKKDNNEDDRDTAAASDNSYSENAASDLETIGGQALDNNGNTLSTYRMGGTPDEAFMLSCATVVVDTTNKTATVTFNGSTPCNDGRVRSGSITYNYSTSTNGAKHYRTPGFKCVITTQNYVVDGNAVQINNKTIQNTTPIGFNPATTNLTWTITSDIKITKSNGEVVTWQCTRNKTLLNTNDANVYVNDQTPIVWTKARVGITGSASGVTGAGNSYTASITSQLVRDFNCAPDANRPHLHPFIQGGIDFTPAGKATRHIDYGNGACDLTGTIAIGNWSTNFTIH